MSANISASPSWRAFSGPGRSRYRPITPARMAPIRSGNTKIAAAPALQAAGAKTGQRPTASISPRSEASTGPPETEASGHGPSPRVSWSSASCSLTSSVTCMRCPASAPPAVLSQAPVTSTVATAAAHKSAADTRPPRTAAWRAMRPQILPGRLPVIGPPSEAGPNGKTLRWPRSRQPEEMPCHPGLASALPFGCGGGHARPPTAVFLRLPRSPPRFRIPGYMVADR